MSSMFPDQIQLIAHLAAKPGMEQALIDAVLDIVPKVLQEPGCISYTPHVSVERPNTVVMYEIWRDQGALEAHAAGANLARLSARFDELLAEPLRLEPLRRIGWTA